jgi:glycine betaine/proline transport system substrate-binding protein
VFVVLAALSIVAVAALGVSASAFADRSAKCGSVTMDENAWAGATANVYVLKYVLEKNLGCTVNIEKLPESTPLFQAMVDGKVDVVPEDWNNIDLKVNQKFIKTGKLMNLGSNGVIGHIGWFIPTYLMKQHPELKSWKGLKKDWSLFKTVDSQGKGARANRKRHIALTLHHHRSPGLQIGRDRCERYRQLFEFRDR